MRDQLASARDFPGTALLGVLGQSGCRLTEKPIHPGGGAWIVSRDVVPHISTILLRLGRPKNPHA